VRYCIGALWLSIVAVVADCCMHVCTRVWSDSGVNAHEGMNVPQNAGIVLAMCFTILGIIVLLINIVKFKCVKQST